MLQMQLIKRLRAYFMRFEMLFMCFSYTVLQRMTQPDRVVQPYVLYILTMYMVAWHGIAWQ